ncbi:hypothetical protein ACWF94_29005 [Streptomyces sp. NPDC055078]
MRSGVEQRRYRLGMLFPEVATVESQYGLSGDEVRAAIKQLRDDQVLQLHDEYQDTYFIAIGDGAPIQEPSRSDLAAQIAELTTRVQKLSDRVQALESMRTTRGDG